ncbi:Xanthine phosphoribosyltransferase 1 [Didymella keratinophila]|nr:Xanthine phosphoribosyltransferase 1 [Didymella keratinophila]
MHQTSKFSELTISPGKEVQVTTFERKSAASSIATTQHVSYNDNSVSVEQPERNQAPLQTAVNSASNLVLETPSSPATAAGNVSAEGPVATVAHTAVVSTEGYRFPNRQACDSVVELADTLPDLVLVPFDDAVSGMVLQGWEDDWISTARYSGPKLEEPKIDFVYNSSFDSLTIEDQLYNTRSDTDQLFALSDDMFLGKVHAASDLFSPLFGHTFGFKDNAYNTLQPPTEKDAERFGEKPFLIYTSWLLNRRFGARKRKGQIHFGHSLSRTITREALTSFPRPALRSASQRFHGETGFQLYYWFAIFHYTIERHREALLWSYIMLRSDKDDDGYFSWNERNTILRDLEEGMSNDPEVYRDRQYYRVGDRLTEAGLEAPKVNTEILWTSMDGPVTIKDLECEAFDTEECLAPGFSMALSDAQSRSPKPQQRDTVVKALMRFQYTIVQPDASFYMVTDAEQARHVLLKPYIKYGKTSGQMCLNDDVVLEDENELAALKEVIKQLFEGLLPEPSSFEV